MTDHPLQGRSSQYRLDLRVQTEAEVPDGAWLAERLSRDAAECAEAATRSRKQTRAVDPAPAYDPRRSAHDTVAPPLPGHMPGRKPSVWADVLPVLTGHAGTARVPTELTGG
jgi:hypothetical protein